MTVSEGSGQARSHRRVIGGEAGLGSAVTFTLAGVVEREADSDRLCEHLSHLLQAVGRVAGACLLAFFHSRLSGFDFPLSFFLGHLTVTAASSPGLSASCLRRLSLSPLPAHGCVALEGHGRPDARRWIPAAVASVPPLTA